MERRYWLVVASREHVQVGVAGGFAQANHGKQSGLKRMKPGDGIVYYSSKERMGAPEPCQRFTAIGTVSDAEVYQVTVSADFVPYRRRVDFQPCREAPIQPLIEELSFIPNKRSWGGPFRYGLLSIPEPDYHRITAAMQAE